MSIASKPNYDRYLSHVLSVASKSTCGRSRCGSMVIVGDRIVGEAYNRPPGGLRSQRRCERRDELKPGFKSDRSCCVHAEERAIIEAIGHRGTTLLHGGTILFARLDAKGKFEPAGAPYCTICSKLALDVGLKWFGLWHADGFRIYDTVEYNDLSYAYDGG